MRNSAVLALLVWGCSGATVRTGPELLTEGLMDLPPEVRASCDLAAHRCSRCHPLERLALARVSGPMHWRMYVDRMRVQPGSGISPEEGQTIVRCLVFRSFGEAGVRSLEGDPKEVVK